MNLKYAYDFYRYGSRYMAVADYEDAEKHCRLLWVNSCGKAIMECLEKPLSREDLITALMNRFEADAAVITRAADGFLARLAREELLVYASEEERALYAQETDAKQEKKADTAEPILPEELRELYREHQACVENSLRKMPESERSTAREAILRDALSFTAQTEFTPKEYFQFGFPHKPYEERLTYLPSSMRKVFSRRMNGSGHTELLSNKWNTYLALKPYFHREVKLIREESDRELFFSFLKEKGSLFCKPTCGTQGVNAKKVKYKNVTDEKSFFREQLATYGEDGFVAEEVVKQNDFMMKLNPTSVNTLRIIAIKLDDRICTYSFLRIGGVFSVVDNFSQGGIICGLDPETGKIRNASDGQCNFLTAHPNTRVPLIGLAIPRFHEAIDMVKEIALLLPGLRYLSFDVALTDEGWVLIEINSSGVLSIPQVLMHGLRQEFEGYLKELGLPADLPVIRAET